MRLKSVVVATLLVLSMPVLAVGEPQLDGQPEVVDALTKLDVWIEQQVASRDLPGLSIAVVFDQDVVWAKGYGFADVGNRIPATPDTVYRIGSITKLFTSTAILQLRDQGLLRLDDPVAQHLPWFTVRNPFPGSPKITIRQLLTHTSGLPREAAFPYWTDHVFPTSEELDTSVPGQDLINPPATTYHYSNLGMALLGEIVTRVSGEPWADYVQENILEPLGMVTTSAAPGDELLRHLAVGYMRLRSDRSRGVFDYYQTGAIAPAGSIVSTVEDLARFASLQFRNETVGGDQIVKGSTLREMQRVQWVYGSFSGGRGLGFQVSHRDGKDFVGHGGSIGGNVTNLLLVPGEKIAVIVAINADDGSPATVARQAYEVLAPALLMASEQTQAPVRETDPAWQRYVGLYADPWEWEHRVLILGGDLVLYSYDYPPHDSASSGYSKLTPIDGSTFRAPDNELLTFELDDRGNVVRIKRGSNYLFPKKQ